MPHYWTLIFCLALCLPSPLWADTIKQRLQEPDGLRLRLVPSADEPLDGLGVKTIHIKQQGPAMSLKWFSQATQSQEGRPWPEYKVLLKQGWLLSDDWQNASSLMHPHLWAPGYIRLDSNGLLWLPPTVLELVKEKKRRIPFEPGFLSDSFEHFAKGPPEIIKVVDQLRGLMTKTPQDSGGAATTNKKASKPLSDFVDEFQGVSLLSSRGSADIVLDGKKEKIPTIEIGNGYVSYTVLQYPTNPLVIAMSFSTHRAPEALKGYLQYLKNNLGYRVTQINSR